MQNELNSVLRGTIDGLSRFDVHKLERQCSEAEALVATVDSSGTGGAETAVLRQTLLELLASTDANLRLLRELRALHARGRRNLDDTGLQGGGRWVR